MPAWWWRKRTPKSRPRSSDDRLVTDQPTPLPPASTGRGVAAPAAAATPQSAPEARAATPPTREAPARPPTSSSNAAPVLVQLTPPFSVRMSQLLWILSFAVGGFTAIYFFVIRQEQLPLIAESVRGVVEGRSDETYNTAADIVFWIMFAAIVGILLIQITLLVSFMSRRPKIRWWQLATFGLQMVLLMLSTEWVALGERRESLLLLLAAQAGLVLLALLSSIMPKAMTWTARQFDVRRRHEGIIGSGGDL